MARGPLQRQRMKYLDIFQQGLYVNNHNAINKFRTFFTPQLSFPSQAASLEELETLAVWRNTCWENSRFKCSVRGAPGCLSLFFFFNKWAVRDKNGTVYYYIPWLVLAQVSLIQWGKSRIVRKIHESPLNLDSI